MRQAIFVLLLGVCFSVIADTDKSVAQQIAAGSSPRSKVDESWVARLEGFKLSAADVDYHVARTIGLEDLDETTKAAAQAKALRHLIDRRLISNRMQKKPFWIGPSQLRLVFEAETARIKDAGMTLEEFLVEKKLSLDYWQLDVEWNAACEINFRMRNWRSIMVPAVANAMGLKSLSRKACGKTRGRLGWIWRPILNRDWSVVN